MERTRSDTQVAERATSQVVHILVEFHLFLAVRHVDRACGDGDGAIGAIALAGAARGALVVTLVIVDKL